MKLRLTLAACLAWIMQLLSAEPSTYKKWMVYYGENLPNEIFAPYSVIVLEGDNKPDLSWFLENGKTVLGYLSLGEVSHQRAYFKDVKNDGILLETNPDWTDSRMIDLRSKLWTKRVIEQLIPNILFQRFSGIFIDTIDNAAWLEDKNPAKYAGMKNAAIELIKSIRYHYPDMPIMLNRGFEILPAVAKDINSVLAESILVRYNFDSGETTLAPPEEYAQYANQLKEAKRINPKLAIYTLDYWNPEDKEGIKKIYAAQRKNGFIPLVSTIELDKIIPEPN